MSTQAAGAGARDVIAALHALRGLPPGSPGYWESLAQSLQRLCRAQAAWLLTHTPQAGWTQLGRSTGAEQAPLDSAGLAEFEALALRAAQAGHAACTGQLPDGTAVLWACVRLPRLDEGWVLLRLPASERAQLNELLLRAQLVSDLPASPRAEPPGTALALAAAPQPTAAAAPAALAALLDVVAQVMLADQFGNAALVLVNTLAAHCGAAQAVLGWREDGGVEVVAISHLERFDARSHHAVLTRDALDEALDHDGPTLLARGEHPGWRAAHALLQRELDDAHLLSLPLARGDEAASAVLLLAFDGAAPAAPEPALAERLRPALALVLPWLSTLRERERPLGLRLRDGALERLRGWFGPQQPLLKTATVVLGLFMVYALFADWDYRIHASGQMATDSTRLVSAQFDGRVDAALANAGDEVQAGQRLAALDTRDLRQQQEDARAEVVRYGAEADKARAMGALAELEIASARAAQAQARLNRVQEQLAQAEQTAPFDGIVVEGERKDLQGAPVRKGDKLYRVARIEGLYAMLQVSERDAALVRPGAGGELVLVGRTEEAIPLKVLSVVPVAQAKGQEGNHFLVRAQLQQPAQSWWRPGMSGAVRIDAGRRRVAWILTHRLMDTVRMALWW